MRNRFTSILGMVLLAPLIAGCISIRIINAAPSGLRAEITPCASSTATPKPTTHLLSPGLKEIFPQVGDDQPYTFGDDKFTAEIVQDQACSHTGIYGLRLIYTMKKAADFGGWGVFLSSSSTDHFDASPFDHFVFFIKGQSGQETLQVVLADTEGHQAEVSSKTLALSVSASTWTKVAIPLAQFKALNVGSLQELSFAFYGQDGIGSVCIDDIAFVRGD